MNSRNDVVVIDTRSVRAGLKNESGRTAARLRVLGSPATIMGQLV
jgi:hypothetical protein